MSLTADQSLVIEQPNHPKLVMALPGSGKTHTANELAKTIVQGDDNHRLLMVTFTRASTNETEHRLQQKLRGDEQKRVRVETFAKIMLEHAKPLVKGRNIVMGASHAMLINRVVDSFKKTQRKMVKQYLTSSFHFDYLDADGDVSRISSAGQMYCELLAQSRKVDLSTLCVELVLALEQGRIEPLSFTHIIVDEFQDTDSIQYRWLKVHQHAVVTVVGDDDQSIYSWRGSMGVQNMLQFIEDFKPNNILLRTCFRCQPEILNSAGRLIANNTERLDKEMLSNKPGGGIVEFVGITESQMVALDGFDEAELRQDLRDIWEWPQALERHSGRRRMILETAYEELLRRAEMKGAGKVSAESVALFANTHGYIAKELSKQSSGWAVLARTNRILDSMQAELAHYGIDVLRIGGKSMWDSPTAMGYVAVLHIIADPSRLLVLDEALYYLGCSRGAIAMIHGLALEGGGVNQLELEDELSAADNARFVFLKERSAEAINAKSDEDVRHLSDSIAGYVMRFNANHKDRGNLYKTINQIILGYQGSFGERVNALLKLAQTRKKPTDVSAKNRIVLSTLNGAKGLQWEKVWLMDVEKGVLPVAAQEQLPDELELARVEEERRLMYVAMTRAEQHLRISWMEGKQSDFLAEVRGY